MIPERLGPYRLVREIARGGMGSIHEGVHVETGARHAVKVILPEGLGGASQDALRRFQLEVQALGRLEHAHVVRVHGADLEGAVPYLVQDLLPGGSLEERLEQGPLPIDRAVELIDKLSAGLSAAHAAGILHRDLKPENVLFDEAGEPRLVDFGLARDRQTAERLTRTGVVVGTPTYMAPEQAEGVGAEDERTDVYGLGAVFYACLTGRPPIESRGSVWATIAAVSKGDVVPPRRHRPDLPAHLETVCLKALSTDPNRRFPSPVAFAAALTGPPTGRLRRLALPLLAGASLLVLALAAAWSLSGTAPKPPPPPPPVRERLPSLTEARDALRSGDGAAAIALADRHLDRGDSTAWRRVRALGLLLSQGPDAAVDLTAQRDKAAVELERRRVALVSVDPADFESNLLQRRGREQLFDRMRAHVEATEAALRDHPELEPPLTARQQAALAETAAFFSRARWDKETQVTLRSLLHDAIGLQPRGVGADRLRLLMAALEIDYQLEHRRDADPLSTRAQEVLSRASELPPPEDPEWRAIHWAVRQLVIGAAPAAVPPAEAPALPDQRGWRHFSRQFLGRALAAQVDAWRGEAVRALDAGQDEAAADAWRNALHYARSIPPLVKPYDTEGRLQDRGLCQQVALHLLVLDAEAARSLARTGSYQQWEWSYLQREAELLGSAPNVQAVEAQASAAIGSRCQPSLRRELGGNDPPQALVDFLMGEPFPPDEVNRAILQRLHPGAATTDPELVRAALRLRLALPDLPLWTQRAAARLAQGDPRGEGDLAHAATFPESAKVLDALSWLGLPWRTVEETRTEADPKTRPQAIRYRLRDALRRHPGK